MSRRRELVVIKILNAYYLAMAANNLGGIHNRNLKLERVDCT